MSERDLLHGCGLVDVTLLEFHFVRSEPSISVAMVNQSSEFDCYSAFTLKMGPVLIKACLEYASRLSVQAE
jgi:hypothetical protein